MAQVLDVSAQPQSTDPGQQPTALGVRLLDALPDLQLAVPEQERPAARGAVVVPVRTVRAGALDLPSEDEAGDPFALLVLDGVVLRNTYLRERAATEILGEGDVIDTARDLEELSVAARTEYIAHREVRVAVLDDRFRRAARRWPALHGAVHAQMARQRRRASTHLAILHLSRVEDRIVALFADLGDRWGRVTPDGILIDISLTHDVLGRLVGSRRPTVTLALAELAGAGKVTRRHDGAWLLARSALSD